MVGEIRIGRGIWAEDIPLRTRKINPMTSGCENDPILIYNPGRLHDLYETGLLESQVFVPLKGLTHRLAGLQTYSP